MPGQKLPVLPHSGAHQIQGAFSIFQNLSNLIQKQGGGIAYGARPFFRVRDKALHVYGVHARPGQDPQLTWHESGGDFGEQREIIQAAERQVLAPGQTERVGKGDTEAGKRARTAHAGNPVQIGGRKLRFPETLLDGTGEQGDPLAGSAHLTGDEKLAGPSQHRL